MTNKPWDPDLSVEPVALYTHSGGANRATRRAMRRHKNDPTPPSTNVQAHRLSEEERDTYR